MHLPFFDTYLTHPHAIAYTHVHPEYTRHCRTVSQITSHRLQQSTVARCPVSMTRHMVLGASSEGGTMMRLAPGSIQSVKYSCLNNIACFGNSSMHAAGNGFLLPVYICVS